MTAEMAAASPRMKPVASAFKGIDTGVKWDISLK
jgi:hypothetical protein